MNEEIDQIESDRCEINTARIGESQIALGVNRLHAFFIETFMCMYIVCLCEYGELYQYKCTERKPWQRSLSAK